MKQLKKPGFIISALVVTVAILAALIPQLFSQGDPLESVAEPLLSPSFDHWFGTDAVGRDLYTRVVYGARESLLGGGRAERRPSSGFDTSTLLR